MKGTLHAAIIASALYCASIAQAEIHDYMILRLVYLNTPCGTDTLERLDSAPPERRFKVTCRNVSAYPDGLIVVCTDPDDDRSCKPTTEPKEYKHPRLLRDAPN